MPLYSTCLRLTAVALVAGAAFGGSPAHAALFDDDEARKAILDLRASNQSLMTQVSSAQRAITDQSNRIDQLNQQLATVRGQNEDLTNQVTILQKQQKDYYTDLDTRLKKFEPQQQTVDGQEGLVQPGENDAFNAALQQFRNGDFRSAGSAFRSFMTKYPQSPYQPTAQYWLGNALYAQRDYKGATAALQGVVRNYPTHPRAPEALLSLANIQMEQGQRPAARKTLQQIVAQYAGTEAATSAQTKLDQAK